MLLLLSSAHSVKKTGMVAPLRLSRQAKQVFFSLSLSLPFTFAEEVEEEEEVCLDGDQIVLLPV